MNSKPFIIINLMTVHTLVPLLLQLFHIHPCLPFPLFLFGDSLVDSGNNNYLLTLSRADFPPYGIDFWGSGGRPTGRFTNGRTIADIVGQALGSMSFPPPNLAPNSGSQFNTTGINYASGSSGILDGTGSLFIGRVPLRKQVDYFEGNVNDMAAAVGETVVKGLLKEAIFAVSIGSNDILNYIQPSVNFITGDKVPPLVYQDFMIGNLTTQLKRLREMGARKFIVIGVGPLGCIPFVHALDFLSNERCVREVNEMVQSYNSKLKDSLQTLNQEKGDRRAMFVYGNSYNIVSDIILNHRRYGFDNADRPCCGGALPLFLCSNGDNATNGSPGILCVDRSKYIFWDAYHPTEAANVIIAAELLDGDRNMSYPINIHQLFNYRTS